jgi:formylglycine-generating enzyme required for sulfatase activity
MKGRILPLGVLVFCSCRLSHVVSTEAGPAVSDPPGPACLVPLAGTAFRIGSDDSTARPEENPGWVRFTHDLWIDTGEMTQDEYRQLSGRNPSSVVGDSLPVTNVSWFDAVLAANARSRRDGLDSVYQYASVRLDSLGSALDIAELSVRLDRAGWRLPTEAEWEAAARAGSTTTFSWGTAGDSVLADQYSWHKSNSKGRPHPVGILKPNAWGLHDMAGNVMEWVGDWKGGYLKDTVEDFAGQENPGDLPDIPLKGGAFNYGLWNLRPAARTATYAAYRSSRAEYVGFSSGTRVVFSELRERVGRDHLRSSRDARFEQPRQVLGVPIGAARVRQSMDGKGDSFVGRLFRIRPDSEEPPRSRTRLPSRHLA